MNTATTQCLLSIEKSLRIYLLCTTCRVISLSESPITFTLPLQDQRVVEEHSTVFSCQLSKPRSNRHVKWFKDGKEISPDDDHFEMGWKHSTHTLCIIKTALEDAAKYTVKIGEVCCSALLVVDGKATSCCCCCCCFCCCYFGEIQGKHHRVYGHELCLSSKIAAAHDFNLGSLLCLHSIMLASFHCI